MKKYLLQIVFAAVCLCGTVQGDLDDFRRYEAARRVVDEKTEEMLSSELIKSASTSSKDSENSKDDAFAALEKDFNSDSEDVAFDPLLLNGIKIREKVSKPELVVCAKGEKLPSLVSHDVARVAYAKHKNLNESILFYTSFLKKRYNVRRFLQHPKHFRGKPYKTMTTDNQMIHYTHFDRGSDTLLVIGGGFLNQERVASFVKMFNQYDVIIFNHRGVAQERASVFNPTTWGYLFADKYVLEGLNGKKVKLGNAEEKDVFAVIYDAYKKKRYKKVYGLALSYSAPIFIKAATTRPGLFDKLILDSCWTSIESILERFVNNLPKQKNSALIHKLLPFGNKWFRKWLLWIGSILARVPYHLLQFDFTPYLQRLKIPVLFFHSSRDELVSALDFNRFWLEIPSEEKAVVLTTYKHMCNHLKRKELYKYIGDAFFALPYDQFLDALQVPVDEYV